LIFNHQKVLFLILDNS